MPHKHWIYPETYGMIQYIDTVPDCDVGERACCVLKEVEAKMSIRNALAEVKMSIAVTFSLGSQKNNRREQEIISGNNRAVGTITAVKICWWIKVNTKSFRRHMLDGAKFPHIIDFAYIVNGVAYRGSRCVNWYMRCPGKGETITVFYDRDKPAQCAVTFGVSL